ncbi:MAG TPA: hypothetical protein VIJ07_25560, partial [Dermatophilaceae bacterium]
TKVPASALEHRRFWDAMHALGLDALAGIQERLAATVCARFDAGSMWCCSGWLGWPRARATLLGGATIGDDTWAVAGRAVGHGHGRA